MRFPTFIVSLCTTTVCLAQNYSYEAICPALADDQPDEISHGYFVQYRCGIIGPNNGTPILASTAKDCAVSCENAGPSCFGSSWLSTLRLCYLSGPSPGMSFPGAVYMERVKDPSQACQQRVVSLQEQVQQLRQDLQTCQIGSVKTGASIDAVNFCQNQTFPLYTPPVISEGGKRYHVWCRYRSTTGRDDATILSVATFLDCIRECNSRTNFLCTQAIWTTTKTCYLRQSGAEYIPLYSTANRDWVTAHLIQT